jgi:anti-sigma factor RsiW
VNRTEQFSARLQAYHDGELSGLARLLVRRRLARDPQARQELESLRALSALVREADIGLEAPDLWDAVRLRLPALDVQRAEAEAARSWFERFGIGPRLVGAGLAAAAAALALVVGLNLGAPGEPGPVRWLDSRGPVLVLDRSDATIIWLLDDAAAETVGWRTGRALI